MRLKNAPDNVPKLGSFIGGIWVMKFKEKIQMVWNDDMLDSDAKLNALLDMTKNFVPRIRLDEYVKKVSQLEKELEQFREKSEVSEVLKSSLAVERLLLRNGIRVRDDDVELKEILSVIISEDYDKSLRYASILVSLLKNVEQRAAKATTVWLLGDL